MIDKKTFRTLVEAILIALTPSLVSLLINDPYFLTLSGIPILLVGPLFAAFSGLFWGFVVMVSSLLLGFVMVPLLLGVLTPVFIQRAITTLALPTAAAIPLLLGLAFIRFRSDGHKIRILSRLKRDVQQSLALKRKLGALERVNRVLENRVSAQKDSITLLHNQVKKLASLSLEQALITILETVELFTETSSASIWRMDTSSGNMVPIAARGWLEGDLHEAALDPDISIEGYVLRNKKAFSARYLLDGSEFDRFDTSRNIITLPILIKDQAWGVLNIEALPFERYSLYTESMLSILLALTEPYLRAIIEYESLHAAREVDEDTGYPEYSILYRSLEKEIDRFAIDPGVLSLIVIEMANFEDEMAEHSRAALKCLLFKVKDNLEESKAVKLSAYHYKDDNQMALLVDGLDQDGASFFCLDILTLCSSAALAKGEAPIPLELLVGFASTSGGKGTVETMIDTVDHLLSIQRL